MKCASTARVVHLPYVPVCGAVSLSGHLSNSGSKSNSYGENSTPQMVVLPGGGLNPVEALMSLSKVSGGLGQSSNTLLMTYVRG